MDLCCCRLWFVHDSPKYIEVMPHDVWLQFGGKSEMEMDMFDVLLRRLRQSDDSLYKNRAVDRWRHFMESDFLVRICRRGSHFII